MRNGRGEEREKESLLFNFFYEERENNFFIQKVSFWVRQIGAIHRTWYLHADWNLLNGRMNVNWETLSESLQLSRRYLNFNYCFGAFESILQQKPFWRIWLNGLLKACNQNLTRFQMKQSKPEHSSRRWMRVVLIIPKRRVWEYFSENLIYFHAPTTITQLTNTSKRKIYSKQLNNPCLICLEHIM